MSSGGGELGRSASGPKRFGGAESEVYGSRCAVCDDTLLCKVLNSAFDGIGGADGSLTPSGFVRSKKDGTNIEFRWKRGAVPFMLGVRARFDDAKGLGATESGYPWPSVTVGNSCSGGNTKDDGRRTGEDVYDPVDQRLNLPASSEYGALR